jgi:hypothetical protein
VQQVIIDQKHGPTRDISSVKQFNLIRNSNSCGVQCDVPKFPQLNDILEGLLLFYDLLLPSSYPMSRRFSSNMEEVYMKADVSRSFDLEPCECASFYEKGGDSLTATQLLWEVQQKWGVFLDPVHLYLKPPAVAALIREKFMLSSDGETLKVEENSVDNIPSGAADIGSQQAHSTEPIFKKRRLDGANADGGSSIMIVQRAMEVVMQPTFPKTRHCGRTNNVVGHKNVLELRMRWQVDLEKCIDASPLLIVHKGRRSGQVVVGSHSGQV